MRKLLIVDDDELMREGFERNICWEDHGITIIGTASDGEDGLEKVHRLRPDIVLTDIRMPFMDGLQMAESIFEAYPGMKVVFLTGYDDFEYVKKALDLKAAGYVLKYEDNEQIVRTVVQSAEELDREQKLEQRMWRSQGLVENKFLSDLLAGIGSDELADYEAKLLDLSFASQIFCAVSFRPEGGQRFTTSQDPANVELLLFSIKNICEETFRSDPFRAYSVNYNNRTNLIFYFPEPEDDWQNQVASALEQVKANIETFLRIRLIVGVGSRYAGYRHIAASYHEAVIAAEMKEAPEKGGIRFYESIRNHETSHTSILKKVTDMIHRNYHDEQLSLQAIAEEVHLTPTYISTLFKKYKEINFSEYVVQIRMNKARELLVHTDMKSYEISEKVGYPNSQYFSVLFKKWYGYSPTEYRQLYKKSNKA